MFNIFVGSSLPKIIDKIGGIELDIDSEELEYINSYRIEKATELLQTETLSISNIALSVGIDNFSYFVKQFKKYKNCTPSQYRKSL